MPTLTQLLAQHGCLLVLDAASTCVQAGLLRPGSPAIWRTVEAEAGTALFTCAEECLSEARLEISDIGAFVFCEGPGSMLGLRTVAMAIRTWQAIQTNPPPAYRYQSLTLLAHEIAAGSSPVPCAVVADARRESWHTVTIGSDRSIGPLQRLSKIDLASFSGPIWQPRAFRSWSESPRSTSDCFCDVASLLAAHADIELFTHTDAPDAYQSSAPDYKKWSAQIHRAPSSP